MSEQLRECQDLLAAARNREAVYEDTLRAVNANANSWHAGEAAKAAALRVIADWTAEALAGRLHPSVEKLTEGG